MRKQKTNVERRTTTTRNKHGLQSTQTTEPIRTTVLYSTQQKDNNSAPHNLRLSVMIDQVPPYVVEDRRMLSRVAGDRSKFKKQLYSVSTTVLLRRSSPLVTGDPRNGSHPLTNPNFKSETSISTIQYD